MNKDWYYLSFAGPEFKGAYIVQAHSIEGATLQAIKRGADPDWHVIGININALNGPVPDKSYLNRPLSKYDVETMYEGHGVSGATKISLCAECGDANPIIDLTRR